ncbi:MAG: BatD family protein [Gammaproteobacteria bacterium]
MAIVNRWSLLLIILCWLSTSFAQTVAVRVDRQKINEGESFELVLTAKGLLQANPNFSMLEKDFVILGSSRSQQATIINGETAIQTQWLLVLLPKAAGTFTIPGFNFGKTSTQPLKVTVIKNDSSPQDNVAQTTPVFMVNEISSQNPYVQSEIRYVTKIYFRVAIDGVSITEPIAESAVVKTLSDDKNYRANYQGRTYHVFERQYTIYPQQAGTLLIKSPIMVGERIAASLHVPRVVRLTGEDFTVKVRDVPVEIQNKQQAWVPAHDVKINQTWSDKLTQLKVGEPITRTINLSVLGLPATQVPDIPVQTIEGLKAYPDKSETHEYLQNNMILSKRIQKITYIPTQAGNITLPEISIAWWDIKHNALKQAKLPAVKLAIASGTAIPQSPLANSGVADSPVATQPVSIAKALPMTLFNKLLQQYGVWPWITIAVVCAWLLTAWMWWRYRRRVEYRAQKNLATKHDTVANSLRQARQLVITACNQHINSAVVKDAILAWAKLNWPSLTLLSLTDVMQYAVTEEFKQALLNLNKVMYANQSVAWDAQQLLQAFLIEQKQMKHRKINKTDKNNSLPDLYTHHT